MRPTLKEIASRIYWEPGVDIENGLTDGLIEAGIDPRDEKERKRLRLLVQDRSRRDRIDHALEYDELEQRKREQREEEYEGYEHEEDDDEEEDEDW